MVVVAWWFIGDPLALLLPLLLMSCSSIGMDHLLAMDFARLHGGVSIFLAAKLEFNLTAMKSMISKSLEKVPTNSLGNSSNKRWYRGVALAMTKCDRKSASTMILCKLSSFGGNDDDDDETSGTNTNSPTQPRVVVLASSSSLLRCTLSRPRARTPGLSRRTSALNSSTRTRLETCCSSPRALLDLPALFSRTFLQSFVSI